MKMQIVKTIKPVETEEEKRIPRVQNELEAVMIRFDPLYGTIDFFFETDLEEVYEEVKLPLEALLHALGEAVTDETGELYEE